MDSLILTFNKEQLNLYKELLEKENIELNFDAISPEINEISVIDFDEILANIDKEARSLLNFNKQGAPFAAFLTQEEIKALIPIYYSTIRKIKYHNSKISGESWKLSYKLGEINSALANINKQYSDFLPYKVALYSREEYSSQITATDIQFKQNIEFLDNLKLELIMLFEKSEKISKILNDFIQKSSKATDEPKFKKFDAYDFFWSVEAFIEQLNTIRKQKEM